MVTCNCDAASTSTEDIECTLWVNWSRSESNLDFEDSLDLIDKEKSNEVNVQTADHVSAEDCLTTFGDTGIPSHHMPTDAANVCKNDANLSRSGSADGSLPPDSIVDTPADSFMSFEPRRGVVREESEIDRSWPEALEIPGREFSMQQNAEGDGIQAFPTRNTVGTFDKGLPLQQPQLGGHITVESPVEHEIGSVRQEIVDNMARSSEILIETLSSRSEVQILETVSKITAIFNNDNASVELPTQETDINAVEKLDNAEVSDSDVRIQQNSNDQGIRRTQEVREECALDGFGDSISKTRNIRVDDTADLVSIDSPLHEPLHELARSIRNDLMQQSVSIDHTSTPGGISQSINDTPSDYNNPTIQTTNEDCKDRSYGYTTIWGRQKQHRVDDSYLYDLLGKEPNSNSETTTVVSTIDPEIIEDVVSVAETSDMDETHNIDQNFDSAKASKSVNTEFVEGLDDIDKFLEEVEPPDELDVGAAGSSIQEVLVGQGAQILTKHVTIALSRIKNSIRQSRLTNFLASRRTSDGRYRIVTLDELRRALEMFQRSCKAFLRSLEAFWDDLLDDDNDSLSLEIEISHEATKLDSFRQGVLGRVVEDEYDRV